MATLARIRTKARRLTRSPSVAQISDAELDEYINDFILYDMPEHLRLFSLRTTFEFHCEPYIDLYENSDVVGDEFYQFKDIYTTIHQPAYVAGRRAAFSQSREQFYNTYPLTNSISQIGTGDGATFVYAGTLTSIPVIRNNVVFSTLTGVNTGMVLYDDGDGLLVGDGNGAIDYVTGVYNLTFNNAVGAGQAINSQTVPYTPGMPTSILYFENSFILRPIPDQPYKISLEAYIRPTELLQAGDSPELEQWWQYIALESAVKILYDRLDIESIARIMPEVENQRCYVNRKTLVTQAKERVATIYTDHLNIGSGWDWNSE